MLNKNWNYKKIRKKENKLSTPSWGFECLSCSFVKQNKNPLKMRISVLCRKNHNHHHHHRQHKKSCHILCFKETFAMRFHQNSTRQPFFWFCHRWWWCCECHVVCYFGINGTNCWLRFYTSFALHYEKSSTTMTTCCCLPISVSIIRK